MPGTSLGAPNGRLQSEPARVRGTTGPAGPPGGTGPTGPAGSTGPQGPPGAGTNWTGAWSAATTYAIGDGVSRNSIFYISNTAGNLNNDPATDAVNWTSTAPPTTFQALATGPSSVAGGNTTAAVTVPDPATFGHGKFWGVANVNTTITMPTATAGKAFMLVIDQPAAGGSTISFAGPRIQWVGDAPHITTARYCRNVWEFHCVDGATWTGWVPASFSVLDKYRIAASPSNAGAGFAAGSALSSGGSTVSSLPSTHDFQVGQGVVIPGAGSSSGIPSAVHAPSVTAVGTNSATVNYKYGASAILASNTHCATAISATADGGSTNIVTFAGNASLSTANYNQVAIPSSSLASPQAYAIYGDGGSGGALYLLGFLWFVAPNVIKAVNLTYSTNPLFSIGANLVNTTPYTYQLTGVDFAGGETPPLGSAAVTANTKGVTVSWDFFNLVTCPCPYQYVNVYRYVTASGAGTAKFMATVPIFDDQWSDYGLFAPGNVGVVSGSISNASPTTSIPAYTQTPIPDGATITIDDGAGHTDTFVVSQASANSSYTNVSVPAYANAIPVVSKTPTNSYSAGATVKVLQTPPASYAFTDTGRLSANPATLTNSSVSVSAVSPIMAAGAVYKNVTDSVPVTATITGGTTVTQVTPPFPGSSGTVNVSGGSVPGGTTLTITSTTGGTLSASGSNGTNKQLTLSGAIPASTNLTIGADGASGTLSNAATASISTVITVPGMTGFVGVPFHVPQLAPAATQNNVLKTTVASVTSTTIGLRNAASATVAVPVAHHDDTDAVNNALAEGTEALPGGFYFVGHGASGPTVVPAAGQNIIGPAGPPSTNVFPITQYNNPLPDSTTSPARATIIPRNLFNAALNLFEGCTLANLQFFWDRQANGVNYGGNDTAKYAVTPYPPAVYTQPIPGMAMRNIVDCNSFILTYWQAGTSLIENIATGTLRYCLLINAGEVQIGTMYGDGTTVYQQSNNIPRLRLACAIKGQGRLPTIDDIHVDGCCQVWWTMTNSGGQPGANINNCWADDQTIAMVLDTPVSLNWAGTRPTFNHYIRGFQAMAGAGIVFVTSSGFSDSSVATQPNVVLFEQCAFGGGVTVQGQHATRFTDCRSGAYTLIPAAPAGTTNPTMRVGLTSSGYTQTRFAVVPSSSSASAVKAYTSNNFLSTTPTTGANKGAGDVVTSPATLYVLDRDAEFDQTIIVPGGTVLSAGDNTVDYLDLPEGLNATNSPAFFYVVSATGTVLASADTWKINGQALWLAAANQSLTGGRTGNFVGEGVAALTTAALSFQVTTGAAGAIMSVPVVVNSPAGGTVPAGSGLRLRVKYCVSPLPV